MLVYASGARVIHGGPSGATFVGEGGIIHVDRGRLVSVPGDILDTPLSEADERLPEAPNHRADFLACVRERRRPIADVEFGARTITCCHLVNLAYWHRRPLRWDPAAWTFIDDTEADTWRDYERRAGFELPTP
jgi:hypothetical protein